MDISFSSTEPLSVECLSRVFEKTTATYKFFWFISLMQIHAKQGVGRICAWDLAIRMVANAWHLIHRLQWSFGKMDSLPVIVRELQRLTGVPVDADADRVIEGLSAHLHRPEVKQHLKILLVNVPYRFLHPWIPTTNPSEMVARSQRLENGCLYALYKEKGELWVALNEAWDVYLYQHYGMLMDFAYWNLLQFLQVRNPDVSVMASKLIRS